MVDHRNPSLVFPDGADRVLRVPGPKTCVPRKLHVVTCISNPIMYGTRYKLYKKFAQQVEDAGAILYTVEMAFGDRPFVLTSYDNPRHVQVRSFFELWHKENMLNLGIQALPDDWDRVAWIDADVAFTNPDWVEQTIEQLEHYMFVQMFSHATDLSPRHEPMKTHKGFVYCYQQNPDDFLAKKSKYAHGHPGFAWAARREALDAVGGLIDWGILGAGDRHMACSLIGQVKSSFPDEVHRGYRQLALDWQARATKRIKKDIGYVAGTINHYYHGPKSARGYMSRWQILIKEQFNPLDDIFRDTRGLWQLEEHKAGLRDKVRRYFRSRFEDDTSEGNTGPLP